MEKEEKVNKANQEKVKETKNAKVEEPKFNKVSGKELKKETKMNEVENKKDKKEKKKNKDKKEGKENKKVGYWLGGGIVLLIIVLVIVTALLLIPSTPEKSIEGMLNCLKNADLEGVTKYVNYEDIVNQVDILENLQMDEEVQSLLFSNLSWKILNIEKEENTASVEIEITNKDFSEVISNYTQEALKIAFSGESFTTEEQMSTLKEQLKNEEISTQTTTTTINLEKQDGQWKVQVEESLITALLPGLQSAIDSLNSIIGE